MPTKVKVKREQWINRTHNYTVSDSQTPPEPVIVYTVRNYTDTVTTGDGITGYASLIRQGREATTSLSGDYQNLKIQNGLVLAVVRDKFAFPPTTTQQKQWGMISAVDAVGYPSKANLTSARNKAISTFIKRAREAQTALQSGIVTGELGKTLSMIRTPALALRQGLDRYGEIVKKRLRRLRMRDPQDWLRRASSQQRRAANRIVAGTWLESVYGWRPLIADVRDGAKALVRIRTDKDHYRVISAIGTSESILSQSVAPAGSGFVTYSSNRRVWEEDSVRIVGMMSLRPNTFAGNLRLLGVSWNNVVPTVWELIPYSFLVDYFTNVGDMLSAASFGSSNFNWRVMSERSTHYQMRWLTNPKYNTLAGSPGKSYLALDFQPCVVLVSRVLLDRQRVEGMLIPSFGFRIPGFTSTKWLNIAALASLKLFR